MKNKALLVALACAIGSGIGTMLALHYHTIWYVGLLVGGIVGYLVYDIQEIIAAVPKAWKYAKENTGALDWKKSLMFYGKYLTVGLLALLSFLISIFLSIKITGLLDKWVSQSGASEIKLALTNTATGFAFVAIIFAMYITIGSVISWNSRSQSKIWDEEFLHYRGFTIFPVFTFARKSTYHLISVLPTAYPIAVILMAIFAFKCLFQLTKLIIRGLKFVPLFFWKLFKLIHSDVRLLVGVDCIIGGAVGMYFENMLVGMLFGGVWGLFNYWIVSIKILKLKPKH